MSGWQLFCKLSELQEGTPISRDMGDARIGVYRVGDAIWAIDDICPHAMAYLSDGFQEGDVIECPLHNARFNLATGKCLDGAIQTRDVRTFAAKIEGDEVFVVVPLAAG